MDRYVEVVLNVPVERGFHYRVPAGSDPPPVGVRVRVPFGRREEIGFCVGHPDRPEVHPVKEILRVLDETPLVLPSILRLTRWIARYYGCSWGEALQAAIPSGVRRGASSKTTRIASLLLPEAEARQEMELREERFPAQARVLDLLLSEGGEAPLRRLRQAISSASPIRTLRRKGIIRIEEKETAADPYATSPPAPAKEIELTPDQQGILDPILHAVRSREYRPFLIHGVTGSGKTEIYIRAIQEGVRLGRGAILLVPEISLTPQTVRWFRERMPDVAVLHSQLSDGQRADQWRQIAQGRARVVIGSRSAVFAPVRDLGLLIVDEEHEGSFKQDSTPRYHARDAGLVRAREEGATACLGSATPSLESYRNAVEGKYTLLTLEHRVTPHALPEVEVVDMGAERVATKKPAILSRHLCDRMEEVLRGGEQVILFLNRRGFATLVRCARCGHVLRCRQCSISLNFHKSRSRAVCHYCFYQVPVGGSCPECVTGKIQVLGLGTEKVMESVGRHFPDVPAARMDSDSMQSSEAYRKTLSSFEKGEIRILVGTQMITKGLHFPRVTLVGVVAADLALYIPDFRAAERTFQLLCQVSGRAGRGEKPGRVVIQTFSPTHPSIRAAVRHDYRTFYGEEVEARRELSYPPWGRLLRLLVQGRKEAAVRREGYTLAGLLRESNGQMEVLGPAACPLSKIKGSYRWQVTVKAPTAALIHQALEKVRSRIARRGGVRVVADVDPVGLL